MEIINGIIRDSWLGIEDHDCFGFFNLDIDFGGSRQGTARIIDSEHLGYYIERLLRTIGKDRWEHVRGTPVRVKKAKGEWNGPILGIGHFINDEWMMFTEKPPNDR